MFDSLTTVSDLNQDQVHIYFVPNTISLPAGNCLDDKESARMQRFHFEIHRQRFLVSHTVLRHLLARYLELSAEEIIYEYAEHGKPSVNGGSELHFNMSHSGDYALYAFARFPIGIDIEQCDDGRDMQSLGQRFFAKSEREMLAELSDEALVQAFYTLWTGKEAWLKALGLGLHEALDKCVIDIEQAQQVITVADRPVCQLTQISAPDGYAAALAVNTVEQLSKQQWTLKSL